MPDVNTCTRDAAKKAYEMAGIGPEDLDLVELHDCFATAEILHYENLGLCEDGEAGQHDRQGATALGGKIPVNVSGGLLSKGHPLGATGIANIYEIADAPARRGRQAPGRRREGRPHARDRPRLRVRDPHPREGRELSRASGLGSGRPLRAARRASKSTGVVEATSFSICGDPRRAISSLYEPAVAVMASGGGSGSGIRLWIGGMLRR